MKKSKITIAVNKTISMVQMVCGIIMVLFFGITIMLFIFDNSSDGFSVILLCLLFVILGIWLIVLSRKKSKLIKDFKQYVVAISSNPSGYIPDIASSLGISTDTLHNNLDLMIKKKYFVNAFIDKNSDCIVIANRQTTTNNNNTTVNTMEQNIEIITIKCKGCGGINSLQKNSVGDCDYCGSPIKAE